MTSGDLFGRRLLDIAAPPGSAASRSRLIASILEPDEPELVTTPKKGLMDAPETPRRQA